MTYTQIHVYVCFYTHTYRNVKNIHSWECPLITDSNGTDNKYKDNKKNHYKCIEMLICLGVFSF